MGTESRLLTLFALLEQISAGTEADPIKRVDDLRKKRDELDAEIARVLAGDLPLLDDTAVKDRFQQFQQLARELLADFREVEHNFRLLDRKVREKIALWEGAKGALLDEIMGERDAIGDSGHAHFTVVDAMDLALLTGQRPADVLKLKRSDIRDGALWVMQHKTGARLGIALIGELTAVIERIAARRRQVISV